MITGVFPRALERGASVTVTVFGGRLPGATAGTDALDFGRGVTVESVDAGALGLTVRLAVSGDAPVGARDLFGLGTSLRDAIIVHDGVDRVEVTPETGMARVGGANFPKGYQTFEAIGWNDGPDGEPNTGDDLELGRVAAEWSLQEYAAVYGDDDIDFIGTIGQDGTFVPALDGPNPDRAGNRNNVGDVWVIATHRAPDGSELTARSHLIVTVPLYMRFEPWREVDPRRATIGGGP